MRIISTKADKKPTPSHPLPIDCITYSFSTGHSMTKYVDGTVYYTNKLGKPLSAVTGTVVIKRMKNLIIEAQREKKNG